MPRKAVGTQRSELIALRITPKMRFGLELLARRQQRTITDMAIFAIQGLFEQFFIHMQGEEVINELDRIWSPHEHVRLVRTALYGPEYLTDEERELWQAIKETRGFWKAGALPSRPTPDHFDFGALKERWKELKKRVSAGI